MFKLIKCKKNSKLNNTPTDKRFNKSIILKLEHHNLKSNSKMSNGNLLSQDKTILISIKDLLKKNSTRKNCLLCFRILKGKKIKWKWKFMSYLIFKLKNPELLTPWNCNFVTLRPVKDLFNKRLLIWLKTLPTLKPISLWLKKGYLSQINMRWHLKRLSLSNKMKLIKINL
jgi:hypothetical protein